MSPHLSTFSLKVAHCNVNSLVRKLVCINDFIVNHHLHIMCISESHLTNSMPSSFIEIPKYRVVRSDAPGGAAKHGVCIYIHESIKYDSINTSCPNCVTLRIPDLNIFVIAVYRPPSYEVSENRKLIDHLVAFCSDKEVLLLGDFNLPSLTWDRDSIADYVLPTDRLFLEVFLGLGLSQLIEESTFPRSGNILDLILVTDPDRVGMTQVLPPLPGCDHCPTICDYVFEGCSASTNRLSKPVRKWHSGKYKKISGILNDIDWDFEFNNRDVQSAYKRLLDIVIPLINEHVPVSNLNRDVAHIPWQTNAPSSLRSRRKASWQQYKQIRAQYGRHSHQAKEAIATFFSLNKTLRTFASVSQAEYEKSLAAELKENPKLLHAYVRRKKIGCPSVGPLCTSSQMLTDDPVTMAETFASSFESVYSLLPPLVIPAPHQESDGQMAPIHLNLQDIVDALQALDVDSAAGPDELHPAFLKSCCGSLAYPLYKIFCLSLAETHLPLEWKTSIVVPIFKKGSRYNPLNYRPISLTSVPCKMLERIIVKHLNVFLEEENILSDHQFGFRAGRSTMDQLLIVYDEISKWMDEGSIVDLVLFDFSKAFDTVSHSILLAKLSSLGIDTQLLYWIGDFLVGRSMSVSVKGSISSPRLVRSGVPQGSVLGPILFLIYINHIASGLSCQYKVFADDLKIYMRVNHVTPNRYIQDTRLCQADINTLQHTATSWGLKLNQSKSVVMRFQRKSSIVSPPRYFIGHVEIPLVHSHPDLGVHVDSNLKFHQHIADTAHKAGGLAQSLLKATVCRSPDFLMPLFCSHVRPIIEYCSCVWFTGYVTDLRVLESVQRRWTKRVAGMSGLDYRTRLQSLNQFSVQGRLLRSDMIQCWKIFHGKCSITPDSLFTMAPPSGTRGHRFKVSHIRAATDVRKRAFAARCVRPWNALPDSVVSEGNLSVFKKNLANALGEKLFEYPT